ncbi:MarR family winged helix-turn-helix transcriptional regulator [Eudoraea sp.]|jgi:DNA-binding MarR family transcriptional regulator|uniref:MarR family winged helix-turn-helix transcriptional regulator n=2 Tax=Eudoraea sp. TaxID=1979955 RepID=UPI003C7838BD
MSSVDYIIDLDKLVAAWIGKTSKMVDYYLHESFVSNDLDLSKEQMIVLKKLHEQDGLMQNELAILTLRDKSTLARLLAKMEKKNYIFREQNDLDKRINQVYLTETGRTIFKKTRPIVKDLKETMEKGISKTEKENLITTLKKIQINFNQTLDTY